MRELGHRIAMQRMAAALPDAAQRPHIVVLSPVAWASTWAPGRVDSVLHCAVRVRERSRFVSLMRNAGFERLAGEGPAGTAWRAPDFATRVMVHWWSERTGLPHQPIPDALPGMDGLSRLSPEGLIVHALTAHASRSFGEGARAAWDVEQALRLDPSLRDNGRLRRLLDGCPSPRAAWIALRALDGVFQLGLGQITDKAHSTAWDRRLLLIAGQRSCHSANTDGELDPFSAHGIRWLVADGWSGRLRQSWAAAVELTRAGRASERPVAGLRRQLQAARSRYRDYRRLQRRRMAERQV